MSTQDKDDITRRIELINNYQVTLQAIQAFIGLLTWDNANKAVFTNSHFSIGRRMNPEPNNVDEICYVTPDIVIQKNHLGYIVEVKKTIPKNEDYWSDIVDQIKKYDQVLKGWWDENDLAHPHSTVLLLDISHSYEFKTYLEDRGIAFEGEFSIVEFTKNDGVNEFIFLRIAYGNIKDIELANYLRNGGKMPIEKIITSYGELKFYDAEPPTVEYLMLVIWQNIFNEKKATEGQFNKSNSCWEFLVSSKDVTEELQKSYGVQSSEERDVSFPKHDWVKKALGKFSEIGYAQKVDENSEFFKILFKRMTKDVLESIIMKVIESEMDKKQQAEQLSLF
jgi:hypothetical protein